MTFYQSPISQTNGLVWPMADYQRVLYEKLLRSHVEDTCPPEECSKWNPCYLCCNPDPVVEPEPELPMPEPDHMTRLLTLLMDVMDKNKKLKAKNKKLKAKNKKLKNKNKNKKLKNELDRAYKQERVDMDKITELEKQVEAHQRTFIDSPAPEEFHASDPDYVPETESEEEEIESEEEDVPTKLSTEELQSIVKTIFEYDTALSVVANDTIVEELLEEEMDKLRLADPALADRVAKAISTNWLGKIDQDEMIKRTFIDSPAPEEFHTSDPDYVPETESEEEEIESEEEEIESEEEDVPTKLTAEELESLVASIVALESIVSGDDGSSFMSEHRQRAQENMEMEMDKLRLADPALADRVAKAIGEDMWATPSESEMVKRLMTPL